MSTEQTFYSLINAIADERLRMAIECDAWANSFAVEVHAEYDNDGERWAVAIATVKMMVDAPRDFFPELFA